MFASRNSSRKSSARRQIDIKAVKDGVLILPRNQYRMILAVSPVNFELKSDEEQDADIDIYESFLNSVGSPLQILVRTREIDMDKYLADIDSLANKETEDIYKRQLNNYREFVRALIATNKILTRHFYVVVPYAASSKMDFDIVREQLSLKVDIVRKGLSRLGMRARELEDLEILDLFYSFYSPEQSKLQPLTNQALELLHTEYVQKGAENENE